MKKTIAAHQGPLVSSLGKEWAQRIRVSQRYYEANCWDFDELVDLYVSADRMRQKWNANVSMAWSVLQNLVADSFFQNPDPIVLPLTTAAEGQARMLRDLAKHWLDVCDTEDSVMRARVLCGVHGGAVIWCDEDAEYVDAVALDDDGAPMLDPDTDEPLYELDADGNPMKEAVRQEFQQTLIDLHLMRFDPDGRRWDLRDHKWISRRYQRTIEDFQNDPTWDEQTKQMLVRWAKQRDDRHRGNMARAYSREGFEEKDPRMIQIEVDEIWSMAHGKIIHIPVDAEFHLRGAAHGTEDGFPMPKHWLRRRMYPGELFAYNWQPPDRDGKRGFYPIPDLRLVKSQLKNLIRLEGLILNLCTQQTTKYLVPDGLLDNKVQRRVQSDVPRELIPVDFIGLLKKLEAAGVKAPLNFDNMIVNLRTEQREQLVKHFEAFEHEVNLIRETLSQGSAQRGGVSDSQTATGQMQVGMALQRRMDVDAERTSKGIDRLIERFFLYLQTRQTLPVYYKGVSEDANDETFQAFVVDQKFREMRFTFAHRTGSARGTDRELLRVQLREAITNALPTVQDPTQINVLMAELFDTFDRPNLRKIFENNLSQIAEQGALLLQQLDNEQIGVGEAGPQMVELLNAFVNAHLTQSGIQRVTQQAAGQVPEAGTDRRASAMKPKTAGKQAFDTAAGLANAGRVGGTGAVN